MGACLRAAKVDSDPAGDRGFITYLLLPVVEKIHRAGVPRTLSIC
ncbi:hypothetical protein PO124_20715 [Bacillus licheniformis]|nr:hypothetical protein [Bacillus licheniformis]